MQRAEKEYYDSASNPNIEMSNHESVNINLDISG